jgi:hypothetical protein
MKKNALLLGVVLIGLLALVVGCDSGSSTASSTSQQTETKASEQTSPPASFMNKRLIASESMQDVRSSFLRSMQVDENTLNAVIDEFTLQKFMDQKLFDQDGSKVTGWEKHPAGWKINFEAVEQQKSAHVVFEAGYDGEVDIKEVMFGGEIRQDLIGRMYAGGFASYLESKGIQRKPRG